MRYSCIFRFRSLKEIALDRFYCIYWSPMQFDIYKDLVKNRTPLTIDATGSVVQKLNRPIGREVRSNLFISGSTFIDIWDPACFPNVVRRLKEWIRSGASIPSEVITDFSLALLNGVSLAFNELNLASYIAACYKCLLAEDRTELPPCYIRVDIAHAVEIVCRWKCFIGKHFRIKDFYVRCFGIMTTCTDAKQFEDMLLSVLVVALSECDDIETECQKRQSLLLERISNFSAIATENYPASDSESNDNFLDESDDIMDSLTTKIETIHNYAEHVVKQNDSQSGRVNPYYISDLVVPLLRMSQRFLIWTNVMMRLHGSSSNVASSARSEAYSDDLKNHTLSDDGKPLRIDKFYVKHMRSIEGRCKIERAAIKRRLDQSDDTFHESVLPIVIHDSGQKLNVQHDEEECSHLKEEENWKGLNPKTKELLEKSKNQNGGKYLKALPDVKLIHNRPLRRRQDVLIRNGNLMPPVRIGEAKLQLIYTCPFDSIVEILATAHMDSASYHSAVDENNSELLFIRIVVEYAKNGVSNFLYTERAFLLSTIMERKDDGVLCCIYNVGRLLERLLSEIPSVYQEECCSKYSNAATEKVPLLYVDSTLIHQKRIHAALETTVNNSLRDRVSACTERMFLDWTFFRHFKNEKLFFTKISVGSSLNNK